MKTERIRLYGVATINFLGIVCLLYFAIPYLTHDCSIPYPDAMLPPQAWDRCGMILTAGVIPLLIVNGLGYVCFSKKKKAVRVLFFLPGFLCLLIVLSYWLGL